MDRGLWITWYDLPDEGREAYLRWLHETYIPAVLERPGFLWAAHYASLKKETVRGMRKTVRKHNISLSGVPTGDQYILMFGAEHAHVFGNPVPSALNAGLPETGRKMLAMRSGERVNIMLEQARTHGPDAGTLDASMALSPCIQLGSFNPGPAPGDEENLVGWFAQCRLPLMTKMPGSVRTRKLVSACGWAKHGILYEFVSVAARNEISLTFEEEHYPEQARWSDRIVRTVLHTPGSPSVAHRIHSNVKI